MFNLSSLWHYNTDNALVLFYFLAKEVTSLTGTGMKTKFYILNINEGDMANYLKILLHCKIKKRIRGF